MLGCEGGAEMAGQLRSWQLDCVAGIYEDGLRAMELVPGACGEKAVFAAFHALISRNPLQRGNNA